jgi:hypothetical protein
MGGCSRLAQRSTTPSLSFDTSYTAPGDWKLLDEGLWGLRLNVPPTLREVRSTKNSLWIHEGANLRVIVDFSADSPESLKRKPNYSEVHLQVNGLPALVCSYDQSNNAAAGSLNKVVALFFLQKREQLGGQEPSYRVEYASDNDRTTALQILQTVRFYDL